MQTEADPLSALLQELAVQEGPESRHTRQTETKLKQLLSEAKQHGQVSEDIISRVLSILEIAASETDYSDERSTASRSSASKSSKSPAQIKASVAEFVDRIINMANPQRPAYTFMKKKLRRLFEDVEQMEASMCDKEELKLELMDAEEAIKEWGRLTEEGNTRQPQPTPHHHPPTPALTQVIRRERNAPTFSGKKKDFPNWSKEFNEFLYNEYLQEGAQYQALLEATEGSPDAKQIVRSCSTTEQAIEQLRCHFFKPYLLIYRFFEGLIKRSQVGEDDLEAYYQLLTYIRGYAKYLDDHQRGHVLREGAFIAILSTVIPYKRRRDFRLDDATLTDEEKGEYFQQTLPSKVTELSERLELSGEKGAKGKATVNAVSNVTPTVPMPERRTGGMFCNIPGCRAPKGDHWTRQCRVWADLTPQERGKMAVAQKWCVKCLEMHSASRRCGGDWRAPCSGCNKIHARGLCELETGHIPGLVINATSAIEGQILLSAETVTVEGGGVVSVLYDSGANVSIVAKGWVDEMNLQPVGGSSTREVELALGGKVWVETTPYEVKLVDKQGSVFKIRALAFQEPVARINNSMEAIEEAESTFDLARGTLGRTGTTAQLLLGADNMMYQPVCVREKENLRLMRTKFGLVVAGAMRRGDWKGEGVINSLRAPEENFLALESLGTNPPRRCVRCQHCQECEFKIVQMSARHAKECERD